jgi:SAM-dependent methyltransferase
MRDAYGRATLEIFFAFREGGEVLDRGASSGWMFRVIAEHMPLAKSGHVGLDWDDASVAEARKQELNVIKADLNDGLPFEDNRFTCVYAVSVLEHLLNGCLFMRECQRVLKPGGRLVLLTPNISTYFTAVLILMGKMPSSGPHPDSESLLAQGELVRVSCKTLRSDVERDTPVHRHLVVFSYRALKRYLGMLKFAEVKGHGFGLYRFPNAFQPVLEHIDPWHCHQIVFVARKSLDEGA